MEREVQLQDQLVQALAGVPGLGKDFAEELRGTGALSRMVTCDLTANTIAQVLPLMSVDDLKSAPPMGPRLPQGYARMLKLAFPSVGALAAKQPAAGGGEMAAAGWTEHAPHACQQQVRQLLPAPLVTLPIYTELRDYFKDYTSFRVPVDSLLYNAEKPKGTVLDLIQLASSYTLFVRDISSLLQRGPPPDSSEVTTSSLVLRFLQDVFKLLSDYCPDGRRLSYKFYFNKTEMDVSSQCLVPLSRPGTMLVANGCVLLVGEEKTDAHLQSAKQDIASKLRDLPVLQSGSVQYVLAYTASGNLVQLHSVRRQTGVRQVVLDDVTDTLNLCSVRDRILFVLHLVRAYDLLAFMTSKLPPWSMRMPYGKVIKRPNGVTLRFGICDVVKTIPEFGQYSLKVHTNYDVICKAYKVATDAGAATLTPYLITAGKGPELVTKRKQQSGSLPSQTYSVCAGPVGHSADPTSLEELRSLALACCKAARLLHAHNIVYRDFHLDNVVRHACDACIYMVIDMESVAEVGHALPMGLQLLGWDEQTLTAGSYDAMSDMHQIGVMLLNASTSLRVQLDAHATSFISALKNKELDADNALKHPWLAAPFAEASTL